MKGFEDPYNMNLTTPDAYAKNYGVEVDVNDHDPQYGQILVRIHHNSYQNTRMLIGLEQAKELQEKLAEAVLAAEYDLNDMWQFVSGSYDSHSPDRKEWTNKDIVGFVAESHVEGLDAFRKVQS